MAYDFFSQPQGPAIPISLFGDAASAGINAGNALPTKTTAIIQGALKGIQTGMDMVQQGQAIEMNQNKLDMLPTTNAMQQEQLESMQIQNDIEGLQRDIALKNKDIEERRIRAELEAKAMESENTLNSLKTREDILNAVKSNDPAEKLKILNDPRFAQTIINDPKFAEGVLGQIYPFMNEQQRKNATAMLDFSKQREYDEEVAKVNAQAKTKAVSDLQKTQDEFLNSPSFQYAMSGINNLSDIPERIKVYPKGTKTTSESGMILQDVPDKTPPDDTDFRNRFTVFKDGKEVMDISGDEASKYFNFTKGLSDFNDLLKGNIFNTPINQPSRPKAQDAAPAQPSTPSPTGTGGVPTFQNMPAQSNLPAPPPAGNPQIIEQTRQQFEQVKQRAPQGLDAGTLDERYKTMKNKVRNGVAQLNAKKLQQQEIFNLVRDLNRTSASTPDRSVLDHPFLNEAPPIPTEAPKMFAAPSESLSQAMKSPVSLNLPKEYPIRSKTYQAVAFNPMLQNESPLVKGLAAVESGGRIDAVSPTGVRGLLQVTKNTAAMYGLNRDIPEENLTAGKLYLYDNLLRFNGNLHLALAAYNAGDGLIAQAVKETQSVEWPVIKAYLKENLSAKKFKEVEAYPDKVITASTQFLGPQGGDAESSFLMLLNNNNLIKPIVAEA